MADMYAVSGDTLTGIANAIRSKTGSAEMMTVASMASAIEGISGGGASEILYTPDANDRLTYPAPPGVDYTKSYIVGITAIGTVTPDAGSDKKIISLYDACIRMPEYGFGEVRWSTIYALQPDLGRYSVNNRIKAYANGFFTLNIGLFFDTQVTYRITATNI